MDKSTVLDMILSNSCPSNVFERGAEEVKIFSLDLHCATATVEAISLGWDASSETARYEIISLSID